MYLIILTMFILFLIRYTRVILERIESYLTKKEITFNLKDFQYIPVEYEVCAQQATVIKKRLIEFGFDRSSLYTNIVKILGRLPKIIERADKSCCGQIRANGYFSVVKIGYKLLKLMNNEFSSKKGQKGFHDDIETFGILTDQYLQMLDEILVLIEETNLEEEQKLIDLENEMLKYPKFQKKLLMYRQTSVTKRATDYKLENSNSISNNLLNTFNNLVKYNSKNSSFSNTPLNQKFNSLPLFSAYLSTICEFSYRSINQSNNKIKDFNLWKYFMYFVDPALASFLKGYSLSLIFLRAHLYEYPLLFFSSKFRSSYLNKIISYPTYNFPIKIWHYNSNPLVQLVVNLKTRNLNVIEKEIFIPTQDSIEIKNTNQNRLNINDPNTIKFNRQRKIRSKFLYSANLNLSNSDSLLIHIHGGGFVAQNCDGSHMMYLKYWLNYNRIPILTMDYRVKEPHPNGLQDVLDVYIWIRMAPKKEIESVLGYYPRKIVITGESSGGNYAIGVALVLNDLRSDYKTKFNLEIKMPNGLFLVYAPLVIHTSICASRVFSSREVLVPSGLQLLILDALKGNIPGLRPNTKLEDLKVLLFPSLDPKPWFEDCSKEEFFDRISSFSRDVTSPYLSPLFYDKFDESFSDVFIHLISAEFCFCLDDSITFAKLYKGPLKIDVLPDQSHGFLALEFSKHNAKSAKHFCANKLTEMFENINRLSMEN